MCRVAPESNNSMRTAVLFDSWVMAAAAVSSILHSQLSESSSGTDSLSASKSMCSSSSPKNGSGSVLIVCAGSSPSMAIQKPSPSILSAATKFAAPTGCVSGCAVVLDDACPACPPCTASLVAFFWHSLSQCPAFPQWWQFPLQCLDLPALEVVMARASSGSFLLDLWFCCLCPFQFQFRLASSQMCMIRISMSRVDEEPETLLETRSCNTNHARSFGIPHRIVRWYLASDTGAPVTASSCHFRMRLCRKARTSPFFGQCISKNAC